MSERWQSNPPINTSVQEMNETIANEILRPISVIIAICITFLCSNQQWRFASLALLLCFDASANQSDTVSL